MPKWDVHFDVRVDFNHPKIVSLVAKCRALAPIINNIPITPNRRAKIETLNILRAVRGTTGIEGAQLTEEEVRRIIETPRSKRVLPLSREREEKEARNAQLLMKWVARLIDRTPNCPLTEKLICNLHKITTKGINYERNVPGQYRTFPVHADDYIPPQDGDDIRKLMAEFVSWFNEGQPKAWDPIIGAIVAHFYVVSIHPFADGNGRTSRAVESFLLYRAGINARGFYSLANYYYQHRAEYVSFLDKVRFETNGDLTPFVLFALEGLANELKAVHQEVLLEVREIAFRDYVRDELADKLASKWGQRMLDFMIDLGIDSVSVRAIRRGEHPLSHLYQGLTPKTLSRDLAYLAERELIVLEDGKVRANLEIMEKFIAHHELIER
jgi:Fic family protein